MPPEERNCEKKVCFRQKAMTRVWFRTAELPVGRPGDPAGPADGERVLQRFPAQREAPGSSDGEEQGRGCGRGAHGEGTCAERRDVACSTKTERGRGARGARGAGRPRQRNQVADEATCGSEDAWTGTAPPGGNVAPSRGREARL